MRLSAGLLFLATLAFAAAPYFSDFGAGFDPSLFPNPQDDPPVQPAGYAFAIWGLIYAWLVLHAGFGLLRRSTDFNWQRPRWALIGSLGIGTFWLSLAEVSPIAATVAIFAMLAMALVALVRTPGSIDRWLLIAPVAVYAGWLSAAAFASLGLVGAGWGVAMGETGWAYTCILAATLLAGGVQRRLDRAPDYGLAVAWALTAITVKNLGTANGVALAAALGAGAMVALAARVARPR